MLTARFATLAEYVGAIEVLAWVWSHGFCDDRPPQAFLSSFFTYAAVEAR